MSARKNFTTAVSFILLIATIYWSFTSLMPNQISGIETPKLKFSTERALIQLKEISKEPHYVGSKNHTEVRNYIISELEKLGLTVEVQNQIAINRKWRAGSNTQNILAKIPGTKHGKSLLLLTHYDSAPHSSLGASDAGSGVVTILEGLRAFLGKNTKPKNDIIILISDAEELGLLGANAFVNHHPWAKNVGIVLNFEARGSGGPSFLLMETNLGNKNLIHAFNQANVKYPVGNSLLYSIYKMLPNDTDLTVFREEGNIQGYNFAFLDDHFDYHTEQDNFARLDKNTLEHQASYLMPLLAYFADADLNNLSSEKDYVFFNFPGFTLVNYPFSRVKYMLVFALLVFFVLLFFGFKKQKLSVKLILKGFIPFLSSLILSGSITFFGWKLLLKIYPQYQEILHGFTYNGSFYITAFVAFAAAINFWNYSRYFKKYDTPNLFIAPIFTWLLINTAITIYLPGAGFFIIPSLFALLILAVLLFTKDSHSNKILLFSFLAIPTILIFVPLLHMFPVGLGLKMTVISAVFIVLLIGILLPIFASYKNAKKLSKLAFLIGVLAIVSASFSSGYSQERKQPNSILYIFDADKDEAYWASYNAKTDAFTKQFLGENPSTNNVFSSPAATKYGTNFKLLQSTKLIHLTQPTIAILYDTISNASRTISLRITPQRKVNRLELKSKNDLHFKSFDLNGETLVLGKGEDYIFNTEKNKHILSYFFTKENESVVLTFSIPENENPQLEFFEASYDLFTNPEIQKIHENFVPRNETMIPMPFVLNDAVVIKKDILF